MRSGPFVPTIVALWPRHFGVAAAVGVANQATASPHPTRRPMKRLELVLLLLVLARGKTRTRGRFVQDENRGLPERLRKGGRELLSAAYHLLTSSRFRKRVRARPRCGNSGGRRAAIGRGVERLWRRSHGANRNPAIAVFPAVAVLARCSRVSGRFTATTAAMEAVTPHCACHCDIAASRLQDAIRKRRSFGSGNQAP